jgi:hypothetical protein
MDDKDVDAHKPWDFVFFFGDLIIQRRICCIVEELMIFSACRKTENMNLFHETEPQRLGM